MSQLLKAASDHKWPWRCAAIEPASPQQWRRRAASPMCSPFLLGAAGQSPEKNRVAP